jgi:DNA-binding CsgD family transcriptional regulator
MVFSLPADSGFDSFHDELYALMSALDEEAARSELAASLERRQVAGAMFLLARQRPGHLAPVFNIFWDRDFSGELGEESPAQRLRTAIDAVPGWLGGWLASRKRPFWFYRYARFIPFSGRLLIDASAPPGKRQLADFLLIPFISGSDHFFMVLGLHRRATEELVRELSTLGLAYAARAIAAFALSMPGDVARLAPIQLSDRQMECLQWLVAGKSLQEIALITGMSYANVRYHLDRAKRENGYATVQQLMVHAALAYNLSPLGPERPLSNK